MPGSSPAPRPRRRLFSTVACTFSWASQGLGLVSAHGPLGGGPPGAESEEGAAQNEAHYTAAREANLALQKSEAKLPPPSSPSRGLSMAPGGRILLLVLRFQPLTSIWAVAIQPRTVQ